VVVEGNMDVISSHQVGVENVVATAGTAMTVNHLKALSRFSNDIRLCFDSDQAGINATERAISLGQQAGVELSIITLDQSAGQAKDPDELIQKDIFKKALNLLMIEDKYDFMDQDVLNIVLENHVKYISPKWNYSGFFAVSELLGEKLIEDEPVIIHFTGREKPWNYMNINKYSFLYKEEYEKIYNKKLDIRDKTFSKIIKKHLILFLYKFFITKKIIQYLRNKYRQ